MVDAGPEPTYEEKMRVTHPPPPLPPPTGYEPPSRSNWTHGVQLHLEGSVQIFLRKLIATCEFPTGGRGPGSSPPPLDPPMYIMLSSFLKYDITIIYIHFGGF